MSVNGVNSSDVVYSNYKPAAASGKQAKAEKAEAKAANENVKEAPGAVYERSSSEPVYKKAADPETVKYLQNELNARTQQLENIVSELISKQGKAIGTADDFWKFLASGDFEVDAQTKAQAQADIAEDGFWGVEATSDRIVDFAVALAGTDPDKLEKMRSAFEKGFKMATQTWGGALPDISQRTYEAVQNKFDKLIYGEQEEAE
ncbi:MAG: hypothetical protein MJ119_00075 [Lachnospiraceae bacterium]|nr:hypothetical protein [Lachnospiraceae bacterium]